MVVNDPRPPFRVRLQGPSAWPESGNVELHANVLRPAEVLIGGVDFYVGEEKVATDGAPPYSATVDAAKFPGAVYARVVARAATSEEANDVFFFGDRAHASTDVTVQQIPVSVAGGNAPLRARGRSRSSTTARRARSKDLVAANDQPLHVILLIDYSESMLEELPVVKAAAKQFARALLRPQDRLAVVGFNQKHVLAHRLHERLEQRGAGGRSREADRRDASLRQRHRDAVRAAEDARPPRAGRAHRRRRSGQPLQARSPRALRALRRRAGLSGREEQVALALDEARRRTPAGAPPRRTSPTTPARRTSSSRASASSAASTPASPRSCASSTSSSSTPSRTWPTSGDRCRSCRAGHNCGRRGVFPTVAVAVAQTAFTLQPSLAPAQTVNFAACVMDPGSPLFPEAPKRHRIHRGLMTERQEHIFTWIAVVVVLLYATAWVGAMAEIAPARGGRRRSVVRRLAPRRPRRRRRPSARASPDSSSGRRRRRRPFLTDAMLGFLHPLRGESGEVRYAPTLPGEHVVRGRTGRRAGGHRRNAEP